MQNRSLIIKFMYLQKQNIKKTNFPESYKKLKQLFDSKRIEEFIKEVQLAKQQDQNFPPEIVKISQDFDQILDKNERAMQILNSPKTNWKVNKINDLSQLAVRVNGTNIEFRYQGILSTNIENLAIMVYQLDLFKQWVPFCTKSQDLGQVSPLEKLAYLQVKMPLLADRYAYIYGIGIDRIQTNGSIIIYGEGITENEELLKKFNIQFDKKKYEKMTVMDLKFFICEISYKGQNQFIFKCYTEMDSRMPYIPEWLMNLVLKQLGGFIFDKVVKLSTNFKGTIWQKKMKEDRKTNPFYDWLHNRMESWHQMNKNPQKKNGLKNSKI